MIEFFSQLFRSDLMPHGHCYLWKPELVWLHAISDGVITISYYFIPVALVYFVRKRKDLPFHWMFFMFGIFILGCGTTHLMEIWTLWHGTYRLAGVLKAITAAASMATAVAFIPLIPKAMALPSPKQLQEANAALAEKTNEVQALSAYNLTRLEEERRHISREVHDEAGQALVAIKLALQVLSLKISNEGPELRKELDNVRGLVNDSVGQLKELSRRLRPPTLDQMGLGRAIEQLASEHQERTGMHVHLAIEATLPRLSEMGEIALYRITQEGLTNAAKHAKATEVWIDLGSTDSQVKFKLRDNGRGFDPHIRNGGLGLLGMRERAAMLDAQIEITSIVNQGSAISIVVPINGTLVD